MAPRLDGLDIHPKYQPVTDWDAIPQFPLMMVKGSEGRAGAYPGSVDYFKQFRRRGFRYRGAYHWIRSDSSMEAQVQSHKKFWDALGGMQVGEFIQLDWETTPNIANVTVGNIEEWLFHAERIWPGRICVYGADWVPGFKEWRAKYPQYPVWYPQYNPNAQKPVIYNACIWQYTSTLPHVDGINRDGHIDGNMILQWAVVERIAGLFNLPVSITNPQKDDNLVLMRRTENDMVLVWDGFKIKRATGSEAELGSKANVSKGALLQIIENNKVAGVNPFRVFPGYEDADLANMWDSRPVAADG